MEILTQFSLAGLVLLILSGSAWWLRRNRLGAASGSGAQIHSRARLQLTPQHSLHVIVFQGREILVAAHPAGCSIVTPEAVGERR